MTGQVVLNSAGNAAFVHRLKCWADNFDAIAEGRKRAEVRTEEDRNFQAGDMLELLRTDRDGKPTEPRCRIVIEVLHVERHAGPLEIRGSRVEDAGEIGGALTPLVVLSLHHRFPKYTETPAAPPPAAKK